MGEVCKKGKETAYSFGGLLLDLSVGDKINIKTEEISAKIPDDTPSDPEKNSVKNAPPSHPNWIARLSRPRK